MKACERADRVMCPPWGMVMTPFYTPCIVTSLLLAGKGYDATADALDNERGEL